MRYNCIWILLLSALHLGCDKPRHTSSTFPTTEETSSEPDYRPQAPMALDRTIHLIGYPLQIRVPDRWEVRYDAVTILQGPTPHGPRPTGVIHLMLSRRGPLPRAVMDALKRSTTKPTTNDSYFRDEIRMLGKIELREQRSTLPATDKDPQLIKWTIVAYEPIDKDNINFCQIIFLRLTREHFEKDRELLESMIASLAPNEEETPPLK